MDANNNINQKGGNTKMETLGQAIDNHVKTQLKNISELPEVNLDLILYEGKGLDDTGKEYKYKYLELNGEKYRVPPVVIGQMKDLKESNPALKKFKVKQSGQGLQTRYTIIPIM